MRLVISSYCFLFCFQQGVLCLDVFSHSERCIYYLNKALRFGITSYLIFIMPLVELTVLLICERVL